MAETILFLCAHNDDQIVGAGGTIAKYAKEGKEIVTIIFSYGEKALPHMKESFSRKTRVIESRRAGKVVGETQIYYLGLREGHFKEDIEQKKMVERVSKLVKKYQPSKIFSHSIDDPHPDHRAVFNFTMDLVDHINYKGEVYSFNVWNFFINLRKRDQPKLVVDITDTFKYKVQAFKEHKSQLPAIISLMWNVYVQAFLYGLNNNVKYAEVFYKIQ